QSDNLLSRASPVPAPHRLRPTPLPYTTLFRSWGEPPRTTQGDLLGRPVPRSHSTKSTRNDRRGSTSPPSATRRRWGQPRAAAPRSEEHTSELQSRFDLVCRLLLEKKTTIRHAI